MGIATQSVDAITCDNPACPGIPAKLSPSERRGWFFIALERYGDPVQSFVYCTPRCIGQGLAALKVQATTAPAP